MPQRKRDFALQVVRQLRDAGFQALWAGGCVRDLLLGIDPEDYDVATNAQPDEVRALFGHRRTIAVGEAFGVVKVLGGRASGDVEVATFRDEGPYSDHRRPDWWKPSTPDADAARRDFTINGLFFDPLDERVLDYVAGQADLKAGLIRAIGDPHARFAEDKLRLLRAVRFSARYGFPIEPQTLVALQAMADQIKLVSAERIAQELRRMLVHPSRLQGLHLADETGLLAAILPEVTAMKGVPQGKPVQPTGDLWDHTLLVIEKLENPVSFTLALGALLHDAGKPATLARTADKLTFYHHEHVGRRIAADIGRRLRLSNHERDRIEWLVEFHMYLADAKNMRLAKLKRTLAHEGRDELLALHQADALASTGRTDHVDHCRWLLAEWSQEDLTPAPLLTGHDLVRHFHLEPGPLFGQLLEKLYDAQLDGTIRSKRQALDMAAKLLPGEGPTNPAGA